VADRLRFIFTAAKGFSPISLAIRLFTWSDVSHVGIQDGGMVVSAESQGIIEQSLDDFLLGRVTRYVFEATEEGVLHLDLDRARIYIGTAYGYQSLPGFFIADVAEAAGKSIRNPFGDRNASMVCSEFALYSDRDGLVPEWEGLDPETTSPKKLCKRFRSGGPTFAQLYPPLRA